MFLGTQVRGVAVLEHWATARALGTWDLGGAFAYQNEPTFLAPWIDTTQVEGATHRTQLVAHVGHTVHMGPRRRSALGLHVLGGWNAWRSHYRVHYSLEDVRGEATSTRHAAVLGGELRFTQRLHRRVGLNVVAGGMVPTQSSYLISLAHVGLGLSFYARPRSWGRR